MRKGNGLLKKLLAVTAIAGGAAVLITKLKKDCCKECDGDGSDEAESFDEENDTSARNYVPISHGEEEADSEEEAGSEKTGSEETNSEPAAPKEATPSSEEIAAKLEQAVAETEARYEEAVKEAETSKDK